MNIEWNPCSSGNGIPIWGYQCRKQSRYSVTRRLVMLSFLFLLLLSFNSSVHQLVPFSGVASTNPKWWTKGRFIQTLTGLAKHNKYMRKTARCLFMLSFFLSGVPLYSKWNIIIMYVYSPFGRRWRLLGVEWLPTGALLHPANGITHQYLCRKYKL